MTIDEYQELVRQLLKRCKDLEIAISRQNDLIDKTIANAADKISEANTLAESALVHYNEETNTFDGHTVIEVSGGADYIGSFDSGFPRRLTLARLNDINNTAVYYHESEIDKLTDKLVSARTSIELLQGALENGRE